MSEHDFGSVDNVIVTIVSKRMGFAVDVRCPSHKAIELLSQEILLLLVDEFGQDIKQLSPIRLLYNNRIIPTGQTLASIGAWDGSYLYIE